MTPSNPEPGAEKALGVRIAGQRPRVEVGKDPSGQGKSDLSSPDTSRDYISHDLRDIYPSTGLPTLRHPHEAPERGQQQGHFAEKMDGDEKSTDKSEVLGGSGGLGATWPNRLAREIMRKMKLVPQADLPEDRVTVLSEIFTDITGELDPTAQSRLGAAAGTSFFEVLAQYLETDDAMAGELLSLCRSLWAHSFVGPIYALLLHRWLLSRPDAGGAGERIKHLHVLISGARDLFIGDAHGGYEKFRPLFHFFFYRIAYDASTLQGMPSESQQHALSVIAGMVPYYMPSSTLRTCLATFPVPSPPLSPLPSQPQAPSSGAAMLATETARMLREMRSEDSLHRYLKALQGLAGSRSLEAVPTMARVRLQIELYSLTTPGAPRWAPQAVRSEALRTLDCLFPMGRGARRLVCFAFRVLHPGEIVHGWARWAASLVSVPLKASHVTATWATSLAGWWVGTWYRAMAYAAMQAYGTSASGGAAGAQPGAQEAPAVEGAVRDRENARVEVPGTGRRISAEEGRGDNSAPALPPLNPRGNPIETPPKKSGFE